MSHALQIPMPKSIVDRETLPLAAGDFGLVRVNWSNEEFITLVGSSESFDAFFNAYPTVQPHFSSRNAGQQFVEEAAQTQAKRELALKSLSSRVTGCIQ